MCECRRLVEVCNRQGLHARPCHAVVSIANRFGGELRVSFGGRDVNAKSILELMTLNAAYGAVLELRARGDGAEAIVDELASLIGSGFGESAGH
jgi:phosphocarrier protein